MGHETFLAHNLALDPQPPAEIKELLAERVQHNGWRARQRSLLVALGSLVVSYLLWMSWVTVSWLPWGWSVVVWLVSYVVIAGGMLWLTWATSASTAPFAVREAVAKQLWSRAFVQLLPNLPGEYVSRPEVLAAGGAKWLADQHVDLEVFIALASSSSLPAHETVAAARTMAAPVRLAA
jgi:hypothetical protein